jgi:uncharacterized tellurite resistance protein B-like protein
MYLFDLTPAHAPLLLQAMRAVAKADGDESAQERALLDVVRETLGLAGDALALPPLDLEDPALDALDHTEREHLVQAMLLMAIMDGKGSREEAHLIERAARRLRVDEPRVANLRQLAEGQLRFMRFDLTRKGYARDELVRTAREEGIRGLYTTFAPLVGLAHDADVARRYIALGELPEGTVGRAYFDLLQKNDLSFPGEGPIGERGVWHDMIHVMGGYPVDPKGEAEVVAFMAGFRREDPFFWVFTSVLQFQVGVRISPFAPGVPDQIDPRQYMLHHARGAKVTCDLSRDWDFRADFTRDLEEVRQQFNVLQMTRLEERPRP